MKRKLIALWLGSFTLYSCGEDTKEDIAPIVAEETTKDSLTTVKAEFLYLADAAVLKGTSFIYGVELDSVALDLAHRIDSLKKDQFDMVPVIVRAKIVPNPRREGWDEIAQIRKILEIPGAKEDSLPVSASNNN